jgi:hypothetical protein
LRRSLRGQSIDQCVQRKCAWCCRKKLEAAAQYWAKGGVIDEREADLKALGASEEQIATARLEAAEQHCEVWEENWDIVAMFLRMGTQWNVSMAGLTGLNYPSLDWLCRLYEVKEPLQMFEGIRVMESAALFCFNSKSAK